MFVDESTNMVAEGTYLFTIGIIPVTLDISTEFIGAVSGSGGDVHTAFQVAGDVDRLVVSTQEPLLVGVYTFRISLAILDFANPDPVVSHVTEAEVRALPPPRKHMHLCALLCIVYRHTYIGTYIILLYFLHIHKPYICIHHISACELCIYVYTMRDATI